MSQARETLEKVFREEYGRIIATLIRISGSFDLAEEALQDAFTSATSKWEREGTPNNPGAWLTTVAHHKCHLSHLQRGLRCECGTQFDSQRSLRGGDSSRPCALRVVAE